MGERGEVPVDASIVDQLRDWDGVGGEYWARRADRFDEGVAGYHRRFLDAAAIEPDDAVLDIGCGSGQTSRDAARRASTGSVLGVDLSASLLALARRRAAAEGLDNVTFTQADAQVQPFEPAGVDVAISRSGAMFFGDPPAAFGNIARALRPGGRLLLMAWQDPRLNPWVLSFRAALAAGRRLPAPRPGAPGPFSLAGPDRVRGLLAAAGFRDARVEDVRASMYFGADVADACGFVTGQFAGLLRELDPEARDDAVAALRAGLAEHLADTGVYYDSAAWFIHARR